MSWIYLCYKNWLFAISFLSKSFGEHQILKTLSCGKIDTTYLINIYMCNLACFYIVVNICSPEASFLV